MEELKNMGISAETIAWLEDNTTDGEQTSICLCMARLTSSILYLREIGVKDSVIEEILRTDHHVLMPGRTHLEHALSKLDHPDSEIKNIPAFVDAINKDLGYMDYLMNIA